MRSLTPIALAVLMLSACGMLGPDYKRPDLKLPEKFSEKALSPASETKPLKPDWWTLFGSKALDTVIAQALKENPSIEAGQAALRSAAEAVRAQEGLFSPQVTAGYNFQRNKTLDVFANPLSTNASQYIYNLHTAQVNVTYTPDAFGLNGRTVESLEAQRQGQQFALSATRITLAGNVALAAIQEAGLREQLKITEALLKTQIDYLQALKKQKTLGFNTEADVAAQELSVANTDAMIPPLKKSIELQRDALKSLMGVFGADTVATEFRLDDLALPTDIPVTLPSKLLDQRPDILAAEEGLHAASAAVGVAAAARYPQITLGTNVVGQSGFTFTDLFRSANSFWSLVGGITAPVFDGGTLAARERQAVANFEQARAVYRQTILNAFQNVSDALAAAEADAEALKRQKKAVAATEKSLQIAKQQVKVGDLGALALLPLQQNLLQSELAVAQIKALQLSDAVALCQALGSYWIESGDVPAKH
jgi:NodT family efflux transporter outer membrane factor (OMF) lipoprotein